MSVNEKDVHIFTCKVIERCLTHVSQVVGKSVDSATIEGMPNNNLRRAHETCQALKRDKTIRIVKEHTMLKTSTSTTTNPNRATEASVTDCKSLIRKKPTSPLLNTKSDHQNKKFNEDSNDHRLVNT